MKDSIDLANSAAIVVHVYYPDLFAQILAYTRVMPASFKLFVTAPAEHASYLRKSLDDSGRRYDLSVVENRGRDVLPFIKLFPKLKVEGFGLMVKVHTKKSPHRIDGDQWRSDILEKLLSDQALERSIEAFTKDPSLGMIGPDGHFIPISTYMGGNRSRVFSIGARLGLSKSRVAKQGFFAGTMFIARTEAIEPLYGLAFDEEDFEAELGQRDGTLAHALERSMALSVVAIGQRVASSANPKSNATMTENYPFGRLPKLRNKVRKILWQRGFG